MTEEDLGEIRRLHANGLLDSEISDVTGILHDSVTYYRERMGLLSNKWNRGTAYDARIRSMNAAGKMDVEIARALGVTKSAVGKRRKAMGLPPVGYSPHHAGPYRAREARRGVNAYTTALIYRRIVDGATDAAIAVETDVPEETVVRLRETIPAWWARAYSTVQVPTFGGRK